MAEITTENPAGRAMHRVSLFVNRPFQHQCQIFRVLHFAGRASVSGCPLPGCRARTNARVGRGRPQRRAGLDYWQYKLLMEFDSCHASLPDPADHHKCQPLWIEHLLCNFWHLGEIQSFLLSPFVDHKDSLLKVNQMFFFFQQ